MPASQRQGTTYILLSVAGYSFFSIWVKSIQAAGLEPLDIAFWRFLFAAPVFWLLIKALRVPAPDKPLPRVRLLGMGTLLTAAALLAFLGLERVPASTFIVLFYTYPAMVAVMSLFMGERLSVQGWFALALTLVGMFLTVPDFSQGLGNNNLVGLILALLNAFVVALYFIVSSRLLRGHSAMAQASAWSVLGALLPILVIAPFRRTAVPDGANVWLNLGALVVVSTVFPVFFLNAGIQKVGPARAAILGTVEPLLTIILAAIFLGERLQPIQLVGGAFILASVIILQLSRPDNPLPPPESP
jgi:drug/metabolite transporter (DMT)-like permease